MSETAHNSTSNRHCIDRICTYRRCKRPAYFMFYEVTIKVEEVNYGQPDDGNKSIANGTDSNHRVTMIHLE